MVVVGDCSTIYSYPIANFSIICFLFFKAKNTIVFFLFRFHFFFVLFFRTSFPPFFSSRSFFSLQFFFTLSLCVYIFESEWLASQVILALDEFEFVEWMYDNGILFFWHRFTVYACVCDIFVSCRCAWLVTPFVCAFGSGHPNVRSLTHSILMADSLIAWKMFFEVFIGKRWRKYTRKKKKVYFCSDFCFFPSICVLPLNACHVCYFEIRLLMLFFCVRIFSSSSSSYSFKFLVLLLFLCQIFNLQSKRCGSTSQY